jgi:3-deoxy-D-manno-octulosonic acid kinase
VHIVARGDDLAAVAAAVRATGSLHGHALQHGPARLAGGRGPVALWDAPGGERWAVRHYWRGGRLAGLLVDRYLRLGTPRPLAELAVHAELCARGVATPPVAAVAIYPHGPWYRADIATAYIPGAADLAALTLGPERWGEAERERAWHAAGRLVGAFLATGARHPDLNLRNILVRRDPVEAYLLDLDRCSPPGPTSPGESYGMLARFHRSRLKLEGLLGGRVNHSELTAFERGRGQ